MRRRRCPRCWSEHTAEQIIRAGVRCPTCRLDDVDLQTQLAAIVVRPAAQPPMTSTPAMPSLPSLPSLCPGYGPSAMEAPATMFVNTSKLQWGYHELGLPGRAHRL